MLRGLCWCGHCGRRLQGCPSHSKRFYRCSGRDRLAVPKCNASLVLFKKLVDVHSLLQNAYQCNQIALTAATQLQQAEIARDKDYQKLLDPTVTAALQQPIQDDIRAETAQINFLRPKIGLSPGDLSTIASDEGIIAMQARIIADLTPANAANRAPALTLLQSTETDIASRENPAIPARC